jgi:hypothetical protein
MAPLRYAVSFWISRTVLQILSFLIIDYYGVDVIARNLFRNRISGLKCTEAVVDLSMVIDDLISQSHTERKI